MHMHSECHLVALYSLQEEEVEKCLTPFLFMVVMEIACIPTLTSMHSMVCKFEK